MTEANAAAAVARDRPSRKLAFIHIPKTAGTSFTHALEQFWPRRRIIQVSGELSGLSSDEIDGLDMIAGHFYAFQIEAEKFSNFSKITLLRDPFERLFSSYRFARTHVENGGDPKNMGEAMRYSTKVSFGEYAFSTFGIRDRHAQLYIFGLNPGDAAVAMPLRQLLEQAKRRLDGMLVGTADHLQDYLAHILRRHGIGQVPELGRHMVSKTYSFEEVGLTRAQEAALRELQQPDFELYEYARELMLRRIESDMRASA